ncbi:MAG: DegV family protein [Lachnospira sp.]|nr:DegV family protein [Lachnospira sp.]MDD5828318.1 DegV family protein [Lachnospira sp.]
MSKVAILTDSNSGITQQQAAQLGIYVIPMPFFIDGEQYFEGINLSQEEFYEKLKTDADISTSQPSVGELQDKWDELLKEYDEIVFIPMSSGLSGTCQTATMLAEDYDGKVCVVNNQRISVTMRQSVLDALLLANQGKTAAQIKAILEEHKMESSIYITLETLKYLKKGGRITPAAAAIGTVLNLKPVLQIQGEKLDAFSKTRGKASAKKIMLKAMQDDLDGRFSEFAKAGRIHIEAAYAGNEEEANEWAELIKETYPQFDFNMDPLSLSVACHIGYGALAIAASAYIPEDQSK